VSSFGLYMAARRRIRCARTTPHLPSPLSQERACWHRECEEGVRGLFLEALRPPHPFIATRQRDALSRRKSGLPDLRTMLRIRDKPRIRGRGRLRLGLATADIARQTTEETFCAGMSAEE
jgi:hypothetical protein